MSNNTETIIDENGIEVIVNYDYENDKQIEEGHGLHNVGGIVIELKLVEVVIAGKGLNILPMLDNNQRNSLINQFSYAV